MHCPHSSFTETKLVNCSLSQQNLETPALRFYVHGKYFWNRAFWNCDYPALVFSNRNPNWSVIVAFLSSFGIVWTKNIWCVFKVKPMFSNLSGVVWTATGVVHEEKNDCRKCKLLLKCMLLFNCFVCMSPCLNFKLFYVVILEGRHIDLTILKWVISILCHLLS